MRPPTSKIYLYIFCFILVDVTSACVMAQAVCQLFERSTRASKASTRKKDLQSFFGAYSDDDFFPLMRLLLPQVRVRGLPMLTAVHCHGRARR
jgi:hypothetical protein